VLLNTAVHWVAIREKRRKKVKKELTEALLFFGPSTIELDSLSLIIRPKKLKVLLIET